MPISYTFKINSSKGRCLIAEYGFPKAEYIIVEKPTVLQINPLCSCVGNPESSLYRCHNCGKACRKFFTLGKIKWEEYNLYNMNCHDIAKCILDLVQVNVNLCFPIKSVANRKHGLKWFNDRLREMRYELHQSRKTFNASKSDENWKIYSDKRKIYKKAIKEVKREAYKNEILSADNKSKAIWKLMNNERNNNKKSSIDSTITPVKALLAMLKFVVEGFDEGVSTTATMCDLTKAFDCVNVDILKSKLEYYGIREGTSEGTFTFLLKDNKGGNKRFFYTEVSVTEVSNDDEINKLTQAILAKIVLQIRYNISEMQGANLNFCKIPGCDGCNICIFCTRECLYEAYKNYHRYECYGIQRHFWSMDDTDYSYLSLRIMLYGARKKFETDPIGTCYGNKENNYPYIYKLESHFNKLSLLQINEILYSSVRNLVYLMKKTTFFNQYNKENYDLNDLYLYVGGLLVKHYSQAKNNCLHLVLYNLPAGFGLNVISGKGKAICPTIALLNHACSPNATIIVYEQYIVVKTLRRIKMGEEITVCYSEVDPLLPLLDRQVITEELLQFRCTCCFCEYERIWAEAPFKCEKCKTGRVKETDLKQGKCMGYCIKYQVLDRATFAVEHLLRIAECYSSIFPPNSWYFIEVYRLLYEKLSLAGVILMIFAYEKQLLLELKIVNLQNKRFYTSKAVGGKLFMTSSKRSICIARLYVFFISHFYVNEPCTLENLKKNITDEIREIDVEHLLDITNNNFHLCVQKCSGYLSNIRVQLIAKGYA
ncbi:hypothetical protein NQ317_004032 [Molorchus minor]|uniref:SET domain-containing protein n=1 Tax=Molorchus minor TaxID=1323400 RepID=A0ABQ9JTY3_9CUCU|nr:hypothetical protein NQ317_004032 [Molorchus minor]